MALELVPRYKTRDLAILIDSGARSILPGTDVTFDTDPLTGEITINSSGGGGGGGTVTSVGMSVPLGLSVSGSPVTGAGTLAVTYAAGYVGYTVVERNKLATVATGATVGAIWGTNLSSIPANITAWQSIAPATKANVASPTFTGVVSDGLGWLRNIPASVHNANYNIQASDAGTCLEKTAVGAVNYTLPNVGSTSNAITISNSSTSGNITIARSGTSLYRAGVDANIVVAPGNMVTIWRTSVAGRWQA